MIASRGPTIQTCSLPPEIAHACSLSLIAMHCRLYYQDSRGLAAMLKELSKSGHGQQALELFDCLQNLPPNHDLAPLADVFSYTTGNHHILELKQGLHYRAQGSVKYASSSASTFFPHDWQAWSHKVHQICLYPTIQLALLPLPTLSLSRMHRWQRQPILLLFILTHACTATFSLLQRRQFKACSALHLH